MSDWGQGAKNNDIGWGQGAVNNDISWGAVHANSWAGDTDILGDPNQAIINAFKTRVSADGGTFEAEQCLKDSLPALIENEPSLLVTPNAGEAGKLFSIIPTNGTGDLDVVRATSATRVNSAGLIESVGNNIPRLDYTNATCPSILIEPQRTNLVFPSDIATTQTRTVTAVAHTLSFYGTGSVTLSGVATGTLNGTGANNRVTLTFTPTAGSLVLTVTGSVTNWQLEAGSNATSLIQTVSTSVTRNADLISKSGISSLIGQTEGTVFVEFNNQLINSTLICLNKNSTNSLFLTTSGGTLISVRAYINSVVVFITISGYTTLNQKIKACFKYGSFGLKLFINGELKATNNTSIVFTASLSSLNLNDEVVLNANSTIKNNGVLIFPTALSDSQCISLTTL